MSASLRQKLVLRSERIAPKKLLSVGMLSSHIQLTDLIGRGEEVNDLLAWARSPDAAERVRFLSGPGGAGKTRLAADVAARLRQDNDFASGFLETEDEFDLPDTQALIIVDYPEERREFTRSVLSAMRDLNHARLLLLTRQPMSAWHDEIASARCSHIVAHQQLTVSALSMEDALLLYEAVRQELVNHGAPPNRFTRDEIGAWVSRDVAFHSLPLYVEAAALYNAMEPDSHLGYGGREIIRALVDREVGGRLATASAKAGFKRPEAAARIAAIAFATSDGLDEEKIVRLSDSKLSIGLPDRHSVVDAVRGLPWWDKEKNRWPRMSPDVVGAALLFRVFNERTAMAPEWFWVAIDGAGRDVTNRLGRIIYDIRTINGDENASAAIGWLVGMVQKDTARARALEFMIDDEHLPLGLVSVAVAIAEKLLKETTEDHEQARILRALSNRLRENGRPTDAMKSVREALRLYEDIAVHEPKRYSVERARCLDSYSALLSDSGDRVGALDAIREAVALLERHDRPDDVRPDIAAALLSLSTRYFELGDREAAIEQNRAAAAHYDELLGTNYDRYAPELARSLHTLGERVGVTDHRQARGILERAINIRTDLASREPHRYEIDQASSLAAYGRVLSVDDPNAAVEHAEQAVSIMAPFAAAEPARFASDHADALVELSDLRFEAGNDLLTVLEPLTAAIRVYRDLRRFQRERYDGSLAEALYSLANHLRRVGDARALPSAEEAVRIYEQLIVRKSAARSAGENALTYPSWRFRDKVAQSELLRSALELYGSLLRSAGRNAEAADVAMHIRAIRTNVQELRSPPAESSSSQQSMLLRDRQHPETVRTEPCGGGNVIIVDVPLFNQVYGYKDIVTPLFAAGKEPVAGIIVESGRYSTYALEPVDGPYSEPAMQRIREFERAGAPAQFRALTTCSVAADPAHRDAVEKELMRGIREGFWTASLIRRAY